MFCVCGLCRFVALPPPHLRVLIIVVMCRIYLNGYLADPPSLAKERTGRGAAAAK
jgi:hypothetical protein